jgi:LuxR family transcriptional regulator
MATAAAPATPAKTGIAPLDNIIPMLRLLAPQGFAFVFNMGLRGPEFVHSEFPVEWQREYEAKNYIWADPVLLWSMQHRGDTRWSEINTLDLRGVMPAAKKFQLKHGAIFCRGPIKKSVLSLARADREFTDEEMALLSSTVTKLVEDATLDTTLNEPEIETLRRFRDGLAYKEIGLALKISPSTVKLRLANARKKLGAVSNVHALAIAIQRNLL